MATRQTTTRYVGKWGDVEGCRSLPQLLRSEQAECFPSKVTPAMGSVHAKHTDTNSGKIEGLRTPGPEKKEKRETGHQDSDKHGHSGKRFEARCYKGRGRPRKDTAQNDEGGTTARRETEEPTQKQRADYEGQAAVTTMVNYVAAMTWWNSANGRDKEIISGTRRCITNFLHERF